MTRLVRARFLRGVDRLVMDLTVNELARFPADSLQVGSISALYRGVTTDVV